MNGEENEHRNKNAHRASRFDTFQCQTAVIRGTKNPFWGLQDPMQRDPMQRERL